MEKENENETQLYNDLGSQNLIDQTEAAKKKKDEIIAPTSTLTQNYMVDDSKLEELMEKYKTELSTLSNIGGKPDVISIDKLNKKLFDDITRVGTLLPIAKINKVPDGTHISNLENGGDITYSSIGRESSNNLTMAETKDGKIYFDEGTKNKFTGVVFVDRIDPKTGNLLDSKDTIRYKDGQVVDFIEGIGGNSRLGQLEQFMESASKFRNMERVQEIKEELAENVARRNPPNQERGTGMRDQHDQGVGSDTVDAPRRTPPPLPPRPDQNRATQDQGAMSQQQNLDVQWPNQFQQELANKAAAMTSRYQDKTSEQIDQEIKPNINAPNQFQQELANKAAAMTSRYQDKTSEQIDQEIKPRQNQTPASTLNQQALDRSTMSPSITQSVDQRGAAQAQKDPSAELAAQTSKITAPYKGMASSEQVEQHVQQKVVDHKKSDNKTVEERIEELRNKSKTTPKSLGENPELASVKDKISYFESKDAEKLDKDLSTKVTTKSKDSIDEVLKNQFKKANQEASKGKDSHHQSQENSKGHEQDQKSLVKQRIEYYENLSKPITPNAKPPLGPGVGK